MSDDALKAKIDMSLEILGKVHEAAIENKQTLAAQSVYIANVEKSVEQLNKTIHLGNGTPGLITRTEVLEKEIDSVRGVVNEAKGLADEAKTAATDAKDAAHGAKRLVDAQGAVKEVAIITSRTKIALQVIAAICTIIVTVISTYFVVK